MFARLTFSPGVKDVGQYSESLKIHNLRSEEVKPPLNGKNEIPPSYHLTFPLYRTEFDNKLELEQFKGKKSEDKEVFILFIF